MHTGFIQISTFRTIYAELLAAVLDIHNCPPEPYLRKAGPPVKYSAIFFTVLLSGFAFALLFSVRENNDTLRSVHLRLPQQMQKRKTISAEIAQHRDAMRIREPREIKTVLAQVPINPL